MLGIMPTLPHARLVLAGLSLGTMLNPLNSTMITVAVIAIAGDLGATFVEVSWVVTVFYLVSCTAQPVLGRFADRYGPQRIFVSGMLVVLIAAVWGSLARDIVGLSAARGLLALGTACAYPSAVNLLGRWVRPGPDSVRALGGIQVVNFLGMALGPALGGLALALFDWSAQFWLNIPLALGAGIIVALAAPRDSARGYSAASTGPAAEAPADAPGADTSAPGGTRDGTDRGGRGPRRGLLAVFFTADVPGVLGFSLAMSALILALLDSVPGMRAPLAVLAVGAGVLFVLWELRAPVPVLDLRALRANPALLMVLLQFGLFNVVFYLVLFGFPPFLEAVVGMPVAQVGLCMAALAVVSASMVAPATRLLGRWGLRRFLVLGSAILLLGVVVLLPIGTGSAWWLSALALVLLGVPYGLIPLGLNQAMFTAARVGAAGVAAGLFQLARYLGAVVAMVIMAVIVGDAISPAGWMSLVVAMIVVTGLGILLVLASRPPRAGR
ncbi:MFS transporter [Brevibacterium pityocampae]|uniref:MFS transporter n=2 Tax=Brevibacterium pityocampae TaxID=506594 RepID=A0ABP8IZL7_9MICO